MGKISCIAIIFLLVFNENYKGGCIWVKNVKENMIILLFNSTF